MNSREIVGVNRAEADWLFGLELGLTKVQPEDWPFLEAIRAGEPVGPFSDWLEEHGRGEEAALVRRPKVSGQEVYPGVWSVVQKPFRKYDVISGVRVPRSHNRHVVNVIHVVDKNLRIAPVGYRSPWWYLGRDKISAAVRLTPEELETERLNRERLQESLKAPGVRSCET
jgi:hypothetical protein